MLANSLQTAATRLAQEMLSANHRLNGGQKAYTNKQDLSSVY
jgi:hypothetical protein